MFCKSVFTGSAETEAVLFDFLEAVLSLGNGVSRKNPIFNDEYYWKVMTVGRNGKGDSREGSKAFDDTGGFFEERGGLVYLTEKAKSCFRF